MSRHRFITNDLTLNAVNARETRVESACGARRYARDPRVRRAAVCRPEAAVRGVAVCITSTSLYHKGTREMCTTLANTLSWFVSFSRSSGIPSGL